MNEETRETLVRASRPVRISATIALLVLAVFLLVAAIDGLHNWGQPETAPTNTITVTGEGSATAIPDTATISFTATATAADVATAEKNMNIIANAALTSIKNAGVSSDDITTTAYTVSPHYVSSCGPGIYCPPNTSKTSGYDVSESIQVKIHDTTKVPAVLDGLAKANVQNVSGPDFVVNDPQSVMQQARAQAIQKAQADARVLASQLGVHLGKVVNFSDNNGSVRVPMFQATAGAASSATPTTPTIPTGNNTYNDTVTITYEI